MTITFVTEPPGAEILAPLSGQPSIGRSGQPVVFDISRYGNEPALDFVFVLEGFQPRRERIAMDHLLTQSRYPLQGSMQLVPATRTAAFKYFVSRHIVSIVGAALTLAVAAVWMMRSRRAVPVEEERPVQILDDRIGAVLGRWRLVDRLGAGGMAVVYKGVPLDGGEPVAIKVMVGQEGARFEREVKVSMKLDHPNIVRIIDWGEAGVFYIVMELIEGTTLRHRLPDRGLDVATARPWLQGLFDAVQYAHSKGIVHRDLKPDNAMVTRQGRVKVMDFGLARGSAMPAVTNTGLIAGSPPYMAPEQFDGDVSPTVDQYALGIIALEMLTGRRPFPDGSPMDHFKRHKHDSPDLLSMLRPDLSDEADAAIARMLRKNPSSRFPSVAAAGEVLLKALAETPSEPAAG